MGEDMTILWESIEPPSRGDRLESVAGGAGALVSMSQFLGRSGWVMAVAIAALVAVPEGVRAQRPPQPPSPIVASEPTIDELFRQGNAAQAAGRFAEAERIFRAVLRREPRNAAAYNNLGIALSNQGKLEEAIAAYAQAIVLKPDLSDAQSNLRAAQEALATRRNRAR